MAIQKLRSVSLLSLSFASLMACATSTPTPQPVPAPTGDLPAPIDTGAPPAPGEPVPVAMPSATNSAGVVASAAPVPTPPPKEPDHCGPNMVLVQGDYCSKVKHTCEKEWFDKSNKKRVCEKFKEEATCVGSKSKKSYCIDKFAWPNIKGERPEVMNNFYQAQMKCAAIGKRMCTESEWTMACEGPEMKPFPYGYERDARKCNGDHKWDSPRMSRVRKRDPKELARLWHGVPSGSQPECVSDYGVHDLPGNNDEVVSGESRKAKFHSVNTGGPWYKGVRNQCRPKIYTHDEGFYYYFLGFRCCEEPDNAETDPRTPAQIKSKWDMKRVSRLSGWKMKQLKERLELKKQGKCECRSSDIKCKTMCGTLLGPNAKDGDDSTRIAPGRIR